MPDPLGCIVVGGGPAGAVLSYMLARQGISVALLELHQNFERDFRGDTLHPAILEIMDELGLAERLLALPHTRLSQGIVKVMQEQLLRPALESDQPLSVPGFVPCPVVRHVVARVIGFGVGREHVAGSTGRTPFVV